MKKAVSKKTSPAKQDKEPLQLGTITYFRYTDRGEALSGEIAAGLLFNHMTSGALKPLLTQLKRAKIDAKTKAYSDKKAEGSFTTLIVSFKDINPLLKLLIENKLFCHEDAEINAQLSEECKRFFDAFNATPDLPDASHEIYAARDILISQKANRITDGLPVTMFGRTSPTTSRSNALPPPPGPSGP